MPSARKTSLGLNDWSGEDKPKRADFTADNTLLNQLLTSHFGDNTLHFTDDSRQKLEEAVVTGEYYGNGKASREFTLPFAPKLAVVFAALRPPVSFDAGKTFLLANWGVATDAYGSMGLDITDNIMTVSQGTKADQSSGAAENLNRSGESYYYAIFR